MLTASNHRPPSNSEFWQDSSVSDFDDKAGFRNLSEAPIMPELAREKLTRKKQSGRAKKKLKLRMKILRKSKLKAAGNNVEKQPALPPASSSVPQFPPPLQVIPPPQSSAPSTSCHSGPSSSPLLPPSAFSVQGLVPPSAQLPVPTFSFAPSTTPSPEVSASQGSGRRVINLEYFVNEMRKIYSHNPLRCPPSGIELVLENHQGMISQLQFVCKTCNGAFFTATDPLPDGHGLDVNSLFVMGTMRIGAGFEQLKKFTKTMKIPCMSVTAYRKVAESCYKAGKKAAKGGRN